MSSFRLVVANVHDNPTAVAQSLDGADYAMLNEFRTKAARILRTLASVWAYFLPRGGARQNPHFWNTNLFQVGDKLTSLVTKGGRLGLSGTAASRRMKRRFRRRRLGPNRWATATRTRHLPSGLFVIMVCVHLPARTQTSERWRWPVMLLTMRRLRSYLLAMEKRYPGTPIILAGDMNLKRPSDLKLGTGWRAVATPADFGKRLRYTQIHTKGDVLVTGVRRENTVSDHHAIYCTVTLG